MGNTHSLSSALAFLAAAFPVSHYVHHLTPLTAAIGTVVCAGAGLLPDLDHPSATPARAFGPISQAAAKFIARVSGGHRHGTHSKWGLLACGVLAAGAYLSSWTLAFVIWACMGLGVRALGRSPSWKHDEGEGGERRPRRRKRRRPLLRQRSRPNGKLDYGDIAGLVHAGVAAYIAYRLTHSELDLSVLPFAVTLGYAVHLFGDSLTESGIPWNYPNPKRYRLASIDTGKVVERRVVVPALYAGIAAVVVVTHGTWWPALLHTVNPT